MTTFLKFLGASRPFEVMRAKRVHPAAGFTLVEMLTVIVIAAILASITVPAFVSLSTSQGVNQALSDVSGILELAKSTAMAQNTYVWVGFANTVDTNGNSQLCIGAVRSNDGSNNSASTNLSPIAKLLRVKSVLLSTTISNGSFVPASLKTMVATVPTATALTSGQSSVTFSVGGQAFSNTVLVVTPQGQVILQTSTSQAVTSTTAFTDEIELAVQPTKGTVVPASTTDGFAICVSGGSGSLRVFRP